MLTAPSHNVEDVGHFSADSIPLNSDDEQLDDAPFLSHQLPDDHESFSEKFLRNILTHDYQNLMPRRREKFVEITKTVTVTEIVNGAPDKHPSSCEVKVTNVSPAGPHPVNVSIKHLHEKWHSCEELDRHESNLGKGTVIRIHETHKPFNYQKRTSSSSNHSNNRFVYEDTVKSKVQSSQRSRSQSDRNSSMYFNKSSDNIIDLEFRHPILVETSSPKKPSENGGRRKFADLRKRVSTTTKTSTTETEKVTTTTRRSSSAHSTSSRSYTKPEVRTLYYRKFVDEETKPAGDGDYDSSDSGSVIIHRNSTTRRSQSADPISPVAPPRKRLGREESLHFYRDDDEVHMKSPEPGNTSVSVNDTLDRRNITAGITSISMNNTFTDTSFESRFSTIPKSSLPGRVNHIKINVIGPIRTTEDCPIAGLVGEEVTMDLNLIEEAPPKPPRRSKWEGHHQHHQIGEPLATSTPMTTIERKQTREERISESGQSSRKSTRCARPPDINIIECEDVIHETRSPARTPATPIIVVNQTPSSRRSSQDLLGDSAQRRRKSTVTDIDWYAAFNMKDPSSPTKPIKPPFGNVDERKTSKDVRRRASDSSMIGMPSSDIDLNQIFACTSELKTLDEKDEKCQCNACRLIRMSEAEREMRRATKTRQSRSYSRVSETRSSTLPSRHRTAPVDIELEDIFNPKPFTKPPTPPSRRRPTPSFVAPPPPSSSLDDESPQNVSSTIDRQVTSVTNRDSRTQSQLHSLTQLLQNQNSSNSKEEEVDWVGQMIHDANEWEQRAPSRKTSNVSSTSSHRKASVARRISVDELTKGEKKKKTSLALPPSHVTIDDIFTALTPKKPEVEEAENKGKKTFIITSKLRAQDVEPIDFEKNREELPTAPPRRKKSDVVSEATITTSFESPTATIRMLPEEEEGVSLDDVLVIHPSSSSTDEKKDEEDENLQKKKSDIFSEATITMQPSEVVTSSYSATISLDDVFVPTSSSISNNKKKDEEDEKIRRRIAEFEKSKQEKKLQKTGSDESVPNRRTILNQSDISMDDIFSSPSQTSSATVTVQEKPKETLSDTLYSIDSKSEVTSSVTADSPVNADGEFEKSKQKKDLQKTGNDESVPKKITIFNQSDISMDDIFNQSKTFDETPDVTSSDTISIDNVFKTDGHNLAKAEIQQKAVELQKEKEEIQSQLEQNKGESVKEEKLFSASNISMDNVFPPIVTSTAEVMDAEDEGKRIEQRIREFERTIEEQEIRKVEEKKESSEHHNQKIMEKSNICMDDVFNPSSRQASSETVTIHLKPNETSSATISLPKTNSENVNEEENVQTRVVESEERHLEKKEEQHPKKQFFADSNFSLDDVFKKIEESKSDVQIMESDDVIEKKRDTEEPEEHLETENLQREERGSAQNSNRKVFDNSNISMDDVFGPISKTTTIDENEKLKTTTRSETETEKTTRTMRSGPSDNVPSSFESPTVTIRMLPQEGGVSLDDVFVTHPSSSSTDEKKDEEDKTIRNKKSDVLSEAMITMQPSEVVTSSDSAIISLDDVFVPTSSSSSSNNKKKDEEDEKIRRRIAEFEKSKQEKELQKTGSDESVPNRRTIFNQSDISMDDIFSSPSQKSSATITVQEKPNETLSNTVYSMDSEPEVTSSVTSDSPVNAGSEEPKKNDEKKRDQREQLFEDSSISIDDVFNKTQTSSTDVRIDKPEEVSKDQKNIEMTSENQEKYKDESLNKTRKTLFEDSDISMDDIFNVSSTTSTSKKTSTTTSTTTTSSYSTSKRHQTPTLLDLFGPQTPTVNVFPAGEVQDNVNVKVEKTRKVPESLSTLTVPGKWNESMMSTTSTISLDDSFNNSFITSLAPKKSQTSLTLPVDNWIDSIVTKATEEATHEAPKTPKHFPSPTRISQEIKYEWIADLVGVEETTSTPVESDDIQHQKQSDDTWVSSVVYRPTLETSTYTLRSSDLDMSEVFKECEKKDQEDCTCSACQLTEQQLTEMRKRQIEPKRREEVLVAAVNRSTPILDPSDISIDDVFNPEKPLHVSTDPPVSTSTRTYYLSPKVSETVTTTHQWKDADISMDEIFSPVSVSSTTMENRRFSNFYEDRSGWDTVGSEDSGVMSGGGRRRSSRIAADETIDEAFKGIFEEVPEQGTSDGITKKRNSTQYDDYYITSLNQQQQEEGFEMDGEHLDVTQFVEDILGKSMDEAAFLSSTKSLRSLDHTDTSIDRKKSVERPNPYYRTRTDTSIDRKKVEMISEEISDNVNSEIEDQIMKLVFIEPNDQGGLKRSSSKKSTEKRRNENDEELLEIEIRPEYFLIKGSYSLLIPKSDPLGQMLQTLHNRHDSLATLDFSLTRKLKKLLLSCIREKAFEGMASSSKYDGLLSSRGLSLIDSIDHASATFLRMNADKYHPQTNPHGVVNFCTAENNICTPLLEERFRHLELFFPNTEHLARYPPSGGWPETREVLVKYFKEFLNSRVSSDELVLTASTRTGYDVVSYCLFEQDDVVLTNGPVYTGTISNVHERAGCVVECVETDLSNPRLDVKKYEEALARHQDQTVSGIIIVNPHNPLGVVFPPEDVVTICNWAAAKNLHVVIDEVFANCVFDKLNSKFRPFLSYRHRVHRPDNVAWLWSVSKDFGLPGLKFAVIHTANEGLRNAALKLQMYHPCSPFVQDFAVKLLSDNNWLREFHTEVTRRMAIHYHYTAENLRRLEIPFVPAQAGIFVFADFSKHCTTPNFEGELELFERLATSARVMLTPGEHQKCHVPGWFRLVFACSSDELEEGFRRLYVFLGAHLTPVGSIRYN